MRKIITSTFATLDGYIDDPHLWMLDHSDDESEAENMRIARAADATGAGRRSSPSARPR